MSELRLEDMPDEILMKVLSNLDIYGNMDCQVFKTENQIHGQKLERNYCTILILSIDICLLDIPSAELS